MPESSNLVQYADDNFVFVAANCINTGITNHERILEKLIDYFVSQRLNMNAEKQSLVSSVNHQKSFDKKCRVTSSQSFYQTKRVCKISCAIGSEPQLLERSKKYSTENGLRYQNNLLCL